LNRYYREAGEAVLANGGHIDKYMGDGMMAIFGVDAILDPEQGDAVTPADLCRNAARAALMIADRVADLSAYAQANWEWTLGLRIGVDVGPVVIGNLGHPEHRSLTAIGDAVNNAERLQGAAKETGSVILVSGRVADYLDDQGVYAGECLRELKGYDRPDRVLELTDLKEFDSIRLLQSTFFRLMGQGDAFLTAFYDNLFQAAPQVARLFEKTDLGMQRRMLLNMFHSVVRSARNLAEIRPVLVALGAQHRGFGVDREMYPLAAQVLEKALEDSLGAEFTPEFRDGWRDLFDRVGVLMNGP
jgi:class 3 adenylate cyclase/hemoglobin-like flavoprotein